MTPGSNDDLLADLKALSTAQLRDAAAYIKKLIRRNSLAGMHETREDDLPLPRGTASADLFFSLDPESLCVKEFDPSVVSILGANPEGRSFWDLVDPEYVDAAVHAIALVRGHREVKHVRLRLRRADGTSFPASLAARWVEKSPFTPDLIDVLCRDITFLKRLGNIEIFSEMLSIGIALVDEAGMIAFANSFAERLFGYEQGELTHQPVAILFPEAPKSDPSPKTGPDHELCGHKKDGSPI